MWPRLCQQMSHERPGLGESIGWTGPCMWSEFKRGGGGGGGRDTLQCHQRGTQWGGSCYSLSPEQSPGRWAQASWLPSHCVWFSVFLEIMSHPTLFTRFLCCSNWQSGFPCLRLQIMTDTQTKWMTVRSRRKIIHIWRKHGDLLAFVEHLLCAYMFVVISLALSTTLCY